MLILSALLAYAAAQESNPDQLLAAAIDAQQRGDYPTARALVDEALAIARRLDDRPVLAEALGSLGPIAREQGDLAVSRRALEEALALWRELGDRRQVAHTLIPLGEVAHAAGDYAAAQRSYEASVALRGELGHGLARASYHLGTLWLDRGEGGVREPRRPVPAPRTGRRMLPEPVDEAVG